MNPTIAVAGAFTERLHAGGHLWFVLHWVLGLERLGFRVLFLDRVLEDPAGDDRGARADAVFRRAGSAAELVVLGPTGDVVWGRPRPEIQLEASQAVALLNIMGYLEDDELLGALSPKVFLDIDPGFPQMWRDLGLHDAFAGHDRFVTIAERIGEPDCTIPTCGLDWVTTKQPVVLDRWADLEPPPLGAPWTTVGMWRGPNAAIEHRGTRHGLRVHEFRKLYDLPARSGQRFEVALDIHPDETADLAALAAHGWVLVPPDEAAGDLGRYQAFIAGSAGELLVAKELYVLTRGGWFSDRSACYLAAGRPVVAQDTGLEGLYPLGEGLLTYSTIEEAAEAIAEVEGNRERHEAGAREVAATTFESSSVLTRLLDRLGLG